VYPKPTVDEYVARLREQGAAEDYIEVQKMIYRIVRMNVSALPNRTVRKLTERPATTFAEFAARERQSWARDALG
jgi:Trk K+ transport system NAD-binding subunit